MALNKDDMDLQTFMFEEAASLLIKDVGRLEGKGKERVDVILPLS